MKTSLCLTCVLCIAAVVVAYFPSTAIGQGRGDAGQSEVQRGLDIAPVDLDVVGKNRSLVGEGSYYVNGVSDCYGCHGSADDGPNGYLGGGVPFGPFLSRNLTPNAAGLPAGLTLFEFTLVMREGRDWKNLPPVVGVPDTLQVMPWPAYRHGTDRFLRAVYEYLRSVPCVPGGPDDPAGLRCG